MDGFDYSSVAWDTEPDSNKSKTLETINFNMNLGTDSNFEENYNQYSEIEFNKSINEEFKNHSNEVMNANKHNIVDKVAEQLHIVPMIIEVGEHLKENEGTTDAHISYLITTKTNLPSFSASEVKVRRRFMDFVWLYNGLSQDFPASVIPPLPEKHRLEYITGDRFGEDFIEKRRVALERFLNRIANHPTLQRTSYIKKFLDSPEWNSNSIEKVRGEGMLENLSDSIVNAFSRVKKPEPKFVTIKEEVDKFEESLTTIEKLHQKILKRYQDIESDYLDLNKATQNLASLETGMAKSLDLFSKTNSEFVEEIKRANKTEDIYYLSHLREYLNYSNAVKGVLKLRDQKQVDFEELTDYLQAQVGELERIRNTGRGGGISSFFKEKYDGMKGVDQEQAKKERIEKCEEKIKELEEAVNNSHEVSVAFNIEVEKEYSIFQHSKTIDLKEALVQYANNKVEFFKRSLNVWESVIPKLEAECEKLCHSKHNGVNEVKENSNKKGDSEFGMDFGFPNDPLMNPYADGFKG